MNSVLELIQVVESAGGRFMMAVWEFVRQLLQSR
jgi:hypothetical protein